MSHKRYLPKTPPAKHYPRVGKSVLVLSDILARYFGLEVPHMALTKISLDDLNNGRHK
jgi:hypothetical protein